jgi:hypothetical protein
MFVWLISHQPAVVFSQNKPAISNKPTVLFSQSKSALAISHQPNEQAASKTSITLVAGNDFLPHSGHPKSLARFGRYRDRSCLLVATALALFVCLINHQPVVLFCQNKPAISHQPNEGCLSPWNQPCQGTRAVRRTPNALASPSRLRVDGVSMTA